MTEPTDRQKKLIDILRAQLSMSNADLENVTEREHPATRVPITRPLTRSSASDLISELQRRKQALIDRSTIL